MTVCFVAVLLIRSVGVFITRKILALRVIARGKLATTMATGGGVAAFGFDIGKLFVKILLPWPKSTGMGEVHNNAETFVGGDYGREAQEPYYGREESPPTTEVRQGKDNGKNEAEEGTLGSGCEYEEDSGSVSVADTPTDEVRVGLTP
jgi:hypothetical protein